MPWPNSRASTSPNAAPSRRSGTAASCPGKTPRGSRAAWLATWTPRVSHPTTSCRSCNSSTTASASKSSAVARAAADSARPAPSTAPSGSGVLRRSMPSWKTCSAKPATRKCRCCPCRPATTRAHAPCSSSRPPAPTPTTSPSRCRRCAWTRSRSSWPTPSQASGAPASPSPPRRPRRACVRSSTNATTTRICWRWPSKRFAMAGVTSSSIS